VYGLSKASIFGEVSIDFADYAEATKISLVSLPIKNSHSDALLHVSVWSIQFSVFFFFTTLISIFLICFFMDRYQSRDYMKILIGA
jgi:hypothetical protein